MHCNWRLSRYRRVYYNQYIIVTVGSIIDVQWEAIQTLITSHHRNNSRDKGRGWRRSWLLNAAAAYQLTTYSFLTDKPAAQQKSTNYRFTHSTRAYLTEHYMNFQIYRVQAANVYSQAFTSTCTCIIKHRGIYSGKSDCLVLPKTWRFTENCHVFWLKKGQNLMKEQS